MPDASAQIAIVVELVLLFAGCVLLWHFGLRPAARTAARSQSSPLIPWDIRLSDFFLFIWLIAFGGFGAQILFGTLLRQFQLNETAALFLGGAGFHAGMFLGVIAFRWRLDHSTRAPRPAAPPSRLRAGLVTFLIALPLITGVSLLWQGLLGWLGVPAEPQDLIEIFAQTKSPALLILMISVAAIIAPVTEELVFRAGLFRFARTRLPRWAALVLPACLFAALHYNLASFVPLAALGVLFSLAYERTGSIAVPMIAHGLFNLNTIVLILAGVRS